MRRTWRRMGFGAGLAIVAAGWTGCGDRATATEHAHEDAHGHDDGEAPATFHEGEGLQLAAETAEAIGVTTAAVEARRLAGVVQITASVFDAGPPARAMAFVPVEIAEALQSDPPREAKILAVRRNSSSGTGQVELVLELPGFPPVGATQVLTLQGPGRTVPAVRRSAVLRTATATFAYVVRDGHFLRTPIVTGASDGAFTEITGGLAPGDIVVTAPVEQLWLTELRLTKGGGHSH